MKRARNVVGYCVQQASEFARQQQEGIRMKFGDTWRNETVEYWDRMAAKTGNTNATKVLLRAASAPHSKTVIEIGCGAGHLAEYCCAAGFHGSYWGCDISQAACDAAARRVSALVESGQLASGVVIAKDFLDLAQRERPPNADVVISRDAVEHLPHWMPLVVAALRFAPVVLLAITRPRYFSVTNPSHVSRNMNGHYETCISIPMLRKEAAACGLDVDVQSSVNQHGDEIAITLKRAA